MIDGRWMHEAPHRMIQVLQFLAQTGPMTASLEALVARGGGDEEAFCATFTQEVGMRPERFLSTMGLPDAALWLHRDAPILASYFADGWVESAQPSEGAVRLVAASPEEIRSGGAGLDIRWSWQETVFGACLVAVSERGVVAVRLAPRVAGDVLREAQSEWPNARWIEDAAATEPIIQHRFPFGARSSSVGAPLVVWVRGTDLQVQVWKALLRIPFGRVAAYQTIATAVGRPRAVRAVANAVGANPMAWLIPCHRVLRATGAIGGYRWGEGPKRVMLAWEQASRAG